MKNAYIVIGAMFGDEGKGHMTDKLCDNPSTLNIRFNGGAQASHTVVTPDGRRHAFRHFGSGTFLGVHTYLSKHFIVNPFSFVMEREELINDFEIVPIEYVHPACIVTTLWDMYINQAIEEMRGKDRHGSCGYGINETVERSKLDKYQIKVKDLLSRKKVREKLQLIKDEYVDMRLKEEYGVAISDLPFEYQKLILNDNNIEMSLFYFEQFISHVRVAEDYILDKYDNLVFEGAQGLLLDQNNSEYFPHVTTSNTGIKNVIEILSSINFKGNIDIYYMSRCYSTRHGKGMFKSEVDTKPYSQIVDLTNVHNKFQGSLRFGYLDFDTLCKAINKDLIHLTIKSQVNVVITCIDQLDNTVKYLLDGKLNSVKKYDFCDICFNVLREKIPKLSHMHISNGLTRQNITLYNNKSDL